MMDSILHYRSALCYNREVFLIQQGALFKAFGAIDANFAFLTEPPTATANDALGEN